MRELSNAYYATIGSFAVDNIHFSKDGLALLAAVDRGELSEEDAVAFIIERAKRLGGVFLSYRAASPIKESSRRVVPSLAERIRSDEPHSDLSLEAKRIRELSRLAIQDINKTRAVVYMDEHNRIVSRSPEGIITVVNACPRLF